MNCDFKYFVMTPTAIEVDDIPTGEEDFRWPGCRDFSPRSRGVNLYFHEGQKEKIQNGSSERVERNNRWKDRNLCDRWENVRIANEHGSISSTHLKEAEVFSGQKNEILVIVSEEVITHGN